MVKALDESGHKANIPTLDKYLRKLLADAGREIRITIPEQFVADFAGQSKKAGYHSLTEFSTRIITDYITSNREDNR